MLWSMMPRWAWFWVAFMVPVAFVYPASLIPYLVWLTAIIYLTVQWRRRRGRAVGADQQASDGDSEGTGA
jgi:hypothetical protein